MTCLIEYNTHITFSLNSLSNSSGVFSLKINAEPPSSSSG
ncbi:unnamed protein product [Schistosoma mattheei]|uniref:Uncharacterized protein n=1 Tax=Schistosoma mattheei TaxID=31246 RepID=A0A3P8J846_9TREM|nr:unnamed protein product [Schistosoma mattheei]